MSKTSKSRVTGMEERLQEGLAAKALFGSGDPSATRIGRFVVVREIGHGGMGVVYSAYDEELDRRVAIKLLRSTHSQSPDARRRMLREAQAMARLSHPNVAQIHEIGEFDGQIFLAMEYVQGQTLRAWVCSVPERSQREILNMFLQAGRGLAAAHAAGLVHRDFKPDNVLVGDDGRARVVDFGLAAPMDGDQLGPVHPLIGDRMAQASTWMDTQPPDAEATPATERLTRTGTILGTLAYMSPEQRRGQVADARSDQYSFCITLYEAFYGRRPFARNVDAEAGRIDLPRDSKVPRRLHQALVVGLSAAPATRWPGMDALLVELARDPGAIRRPWLLATTTALAIGAAGSCLYHRRESESVICQDLGPRLAGTWDNERKEALRGAFLQVPRAHAEATWARTEVTIDAFAAAWVEMSRENCEATHVRGEQSGEALDLRTLCLARRRHDLQALTDVYAAADAQVVDNAVQAAQSLPSLDRCANLEALRTTVRPPNDPAQRANVERLRARLAEAHALHQAGKLKEGLTLLEPLLAEVEVVAHPPLTAQAMHVLGRLQEKFDPEAAERSLYAAIRAGAAGRDDMLIAQALTRLVYVIGGVKHEYTAALALGRAAEAAVIRDGDSPIERAELDNHLGIVRFYMGDFEQALKHHQRALDARTAAFGPYHPAVAKSLSNLGATLTKLARFDEAALRQQQSIVLYERTLGPDHPLLASAENNLGIVRDKQGRFAEAIEHYRRALGIYERTYGADHPEVGLALSNLGIAAQHLDRHDEAAVYLERSLELKERARGPGAVELSYTLNSLATTRVVQGRLAEARELLVRAIAIHERAGGPEQPEAAAALSNLADLDLHEGDLAAAGGGYERALALRERAFGPDHPDVASVLVSRSTLRLREQQATSALADAERALTIYEATGPPPLELPSALIAIGEAQLALDRPEPAVTSLARALDLLLRRGAPAIELADAQFPLARALWDRDDRQRGWALKLARTARAAFAARNEEALRAVIAWLAVRDGDEGVR